ncbi:MAG: hypothetical protein JWM95_753 [Gemmatimonadetes bacterium]|nr:hypothetical protein [Gemmatimonadota bacterium]
MTCLIGTPIVSDANHTYSPTFSGPAWLTSGDVRLSNALVRDSALVARSVDATNANTWFDVDLKRPCRVRGLLLGYHNLTTAAKLRTRGFVTPPCFDSLTVGDASWTANGTPTRSAAAFTCADGTPLDLIGDDDGAATESFTKAMPFTGNGTKTLRLRIARNSAFANHAVTVVDTTAGVTRFFSYIDFTSATPVMSPGPGTLVSLTARGDGAWDAVVAIPGIVAANTNTVNAYGGANGAANMASFYIGDLMAWDAATDQLAYTTGVADAWPVVYGSGSLPTGDPRLIASGGTGKYTDEEAAELRARQPIHWIHATPAVASARYWRTQIYDAANPAGYVEFGRLMITAGLQPTANFDYGATLGFDTGSIRSVADGGAGIYAEKWMARQAVVTFGEAPEAEALAQHFEFQRLIGTTGQFLWIHDANDTTNMLRRSYPAVIEKLSPFSFPNYARNSVPYAIREEL